MAAVGVVFDPRPAGELGDPPTAWKPKFGSVALAAAMISWFDSGCEGPGRFFVVRLSGMSWLMAAVYDRATRQVEAAGVAQWRHELLAPLSGSVLEVGAGTGRNLSHYPDSLDRLVLTEPDRFMRAKLRSAVEKAPLGCAVEIVDAPAEHLPFPDDSFDAVVATLVFCSVADPAASLAEIRRVLRPKGRLVFLEHVAAEDRPSRLRWQRRLEPIWKRLAGGCHLTRVTDRLITESGFEIEHLERATMRKAPPVVRPTVRGTARLAGAGPVQVPVPGD